MKLYAPGYYKKFKCIADRCRHSCCIGWEIDIDADTMKKYEGLTEGYGESIRQSIEEGEAPHFRLSANERCPHLDGDGLCRIITNLGEDCLCNICREHPRFYNDTPKGKEAGLGLSCEEACRIILSSDEYCSLEPIGEQEDEIKKEFDALPMRKKLYGILSDRTVPYEERLQAIYAEFGISPASTADSQWIELLSGLEYLDPAHRELFSCYSSALATPAAFELPLERALAYFIYRHVTAAESEDEARAALGFALLCERLLASVAKSGADIFEAARIISEELEYSEENTEAIKFEFWF